ncbi:LOW QUALITY PROTEIN: probable cytochrome P450 6d5 [Drosophila eugracilis]|uniref:LOW QUALITY PROTEIN: probable cytochrome P450 6d5 n=1 Tax=Drosophila eugracilis TaxID=29029 RepID=UPI001BDA0097|nr:LOW QUALITY PROTEIN: probable cytochrome P450 6d5 [Drosophila eugracilis]
MIGIYLLIGAVTLLYVYLKWTFSYWDRKGFPSTGVSIPFGALDSVTKGKRSFGLAIYDMYKATKEPVVGLYLTLRPALLVRDAQLAHDVLVKDFASFHDRGVYVDEENDPMSGSLFQLEGASWRALRNKLSPSFTSGKLKAMFQTSNSVGDKLVASIREQLPESGSKELEMKRLMATFAIDIIATTIFGLDVDSFADPNNEFQVISKKVNRKNFEDIVRGTASFLFPGLEKFFVRIGWKQEATERMRELSHRTVDLREKNNIVRKDLLQLLLQLRNQGQVNTDDNVWSAESTTNGVKSMSKDLIAGQLFLFYIAGYETTASTASFTLYELTQNPEILEKAKEDVRKAIEKHGELSYDAIADMKYLEACVLETSRKYPALPILNRICTQDYPVPDSKLVIKKGTPIIISLFGIHRDPEYFPDPLSYQPERYLEDNKNYNQAAYLPFGEGPRMCIGARMGKVNVKIAIAKILSNFDLEIPKEKQEIEFGINGVPLMPKTGVPVRLSLKK